MIQFDHYSVSLQLQTAIIHKYYTMVLVVEFGKGEKVIGCVYFSLVNVYSTVK